MIPVALTATAAQTAGARTRVADAYGKAEKRLSVTDTKWTPINVSDLLGPDATIRTGDNAAVILVFPDKHAFRIGEGAEVRLKEVGQNRSYSFELIKGEVWSFVNKAKKPAKYEVETPSTVLGVSGTLFSVDHDPGADESEVSVAEGEVNMRQGGATHRIGKGFMTRLRRGQVDPARLEQHNDSIRQMWEHLQQSENWTKGSDAPKLNKQTEQRLRTLKQAQRLLRQRGQRAQRRGNAEQTEQNETQRGNTQTPRGRGNRQQPNKTQ